MKNIYLLDTNAFFNFIKYASVVSSDDGSNELFRATIEKIRAGKCYISLISTVEIVSVIGKYARGGAGANNKRMKPSVVKRWLKLVEDLVSGKSSFLPLSTLSFSQRTITEAQQIVQYSLVHNFGSLDAIIAATAKECCSNNGYENTLLVTSDKGLKACLAECRIPYWDAFQKSSQL